MELVRPACRGLGDGEAAGGRCRSILPGARVGVRDHEERLPAPPKPPELPSDPALPKLPRLSTLSRSRCPRSSLPCPPWTTLSAATSTWVGSLDKRLGPAIGVVELRPVAPLSVRATGEPASRAATSDRRFSRPGVVPSFDGLGEEDSGECETNKLRGRRASGECNSSLAILSWVWYGYVMGVVMQET